MAAKKVYAVRKGKKTGIFHTWQECKDSVDGFPGAEYKGFASVEEANAYLQIEGGRSTVRNKNQQIDKMEQNRIENSRSQENKVTISSRVSKTIGQEERPEEEGKLLVYVDGSYKHSMKKYAFGCVFILYDGTVYVENGNGNNAESALLRNVTGEMLGAMYAVRWAMKNNFSKIEIRYDYEGIEKWVTGVWKSKTELTQKYAKAMREWKQSIEIQFTKVAAHSNIYYNEMADQLAKDALEKEDGIPEIMLMKDMNSL